MKRTRDRFAHSQVIARRVSAQYRRSCREDIILSAGWKVLTASSVGVATARQCRNKTASGLLIEDRDIGSDGRNGVPAVDRDGVFVGANGVCRAPNHRRSGDDQPTEVEQDLTTF